MSITHKAFMGSCPGRASEALGAAVHVRMNAAQPGTVLATGHTADASGYGAMREMLATPKNMRI